MLTVLGFAVLLLSGCGDADNPLDRFRFDAAVPGTRGVGQACELAEDCRQGLVCTAATCQPAMNVPAGGSCQLSADCAADLYCSPARTCADAGDGEDGADCTSDADCTKGFVCSVEGFGQRCRASGETDLGAMCASTRDCLAGLSCIPSPAGGEYQCLSASAVPGGIVPPAIPFWPGETCEEDTGPATSYFQVPRGNDQDKDFYRLPYPNDIRRTESGLNLDGHPSPGTALPIDIIGRYLEAGEQDLDGFATNPVVFFRFSKPYNWDTIAANIKLVDITPGSPSYNQGQALSWLTTNGSLSRYICPDWLGIRAPHGQPLRPETTYAVIIQTGIEVSAEAGGGAYQRGPDFEAMLAEAAPSDAALASAHAAYAPLRAFVADTEVDPTTILNAAVFTTQEIDDWGAGLRAAIRAEDAPTVSELTVCDGTTMSPCDDGSEQRECGTPNPNYVEIHGKITLPIFQHGTPPYEAPEDGGGFMIAGGGRPTLARTEEVCFALTLPKDATPPENGYPLLIGAHGTGGSFRTVVRSGGLAEAVSNAMVGEETLRAATLAIDLPQHGARRGGSTRGEDVLFYNFLNPRAARDNVRQGTADLMSLVYFAETFTGMAPNEQEIRFDPSRIALFAHSQGATHASLMLPHEPGILAVVLSGNGGDLTQSLLHKTEPIDIAGVLPFALLDPNPEGKLAGGDFHPTLAIFQQYFEVVDGVNYARRLLAPYDPTTPSPHVFMSYGEGDTYSPEPTLQAYISAAGFPLVLPLVTDGMYAASTIAPPLTGNVTFGEMEMAVMRTLGAREYRPDAGDDGHFVATRTETGLADTIRFLTQALAGQVPSIGE